MPAVLRLLHYSLRRRPPTSVVSWRPARASWWPSGGVASFSSTACRRGGGYAPSSSPFSRQWKASSQGTEGVGNQSFPSCRSNVTHAAHSSYRMNIVKTPIIIETIIGPFVWGAVGRSGPSLSHVSVSRGWVCGGGSRLGHEIHAHRDSFSRMRCGTRVAHREHKKTPIRESESPLLLLLPTS